MTDASANASAKANELVTNLTNGVKRAVQPDFEALQKVLAQILVGISGLDSRVAALEATVATAPKMKVRTAAAPRAEGAAEGGAAEAVSATSEREDKVKNSLLYFRYAMGKGYPFTTVVDGAQVATTYREHYDTAARRAGVEDKIKAIKATAGSVEYFESLGSQLWSQLTEAEKATVSADFKKWQAERAAGGAPQLDESK